MDAAPAVARRRRHRSIRPGFVHGDAAGRPQHLSVRSRMQTPSYGRAAANLTTAAFVLALTGVVGGTADAASAVPESYDGSPIVSHAELDVHPRDFEPAPHGPQVGATI